MTFELVSKLDRQFLISVLMLAWEAHYGPLRVRYCEEKIVRESSTRLFPSQKGFKLMKGQKIVMAVWFPQEAKPTKKSVAGAFEDKVDIADAQLKAIRRPNRLLLRVNWVNVNRH